jgi:hypothetical protein
LVAEYHILDARYVTAVTKYMTHLETQTAELAYLKVKGIPQHGRKEHQLMKINIAIFVCAFLFTLVGANAQTPSADADREAIKQTALDYIEGWYEANAERMERALSPDLAKRIVRTNDKGQSMLQQMSAMSLVQGVKRGGGKDTPKDKQQKDVTILDIFENAASVKVVASDWIDYLHVAKFNGRWVIVNVLWELKPKPKA